MFLVARTIKGDKDDERCSRPDAKRQNGGIDLAQDVHVFALMPPDGFYLNMCADINTVIWRGHLWKRAC